jgi:hypothetical protein
MMRLPADWKRRYFHRLDNGDYQIHDDLRNSVSFPWPTSWSRSRCVRCPTSTSFSVATC